MVSASILGLYVIGIFTCCMSLFNYLRFAALNRHDGDNSGGVVDDIISRGRRDIGDKTSLPVLPGEKGSLFANIRELQGFIREEINQTINDLLEQVLEDRLRKWSEERKCDCLGQKKGSGITGPRGPKGVKGERGPPGEPGPSLHPPELKRKTLDVTANVSETKTLMCEFLGNPIPSTEWNTSTVNRKVNVEVDRERSMVTTHIEIENITWSDRGHVICSASNLLGKSSASGFLTVHAPPIIFLPPKPLVATLGSTIHFPECKVISDPPATITWERGFPLFPKGRTWRSNGNLRISAAKVRDEGYYHCIAKNYLGTASKFIQLRVRPLQFSKKSPFYIYKINSNATLTCGAHGSPGRMSGKWSTYREDKPLNYTTIQNGSEFVVSVDVEHGGKYRCSISDNITTIESFTDVALFKLNTSLMTPKDIKVLGGWLGSGFVGEYRLCWSQNLHGSRVSTFHQRCDNKPNTITIFQSEGGEVFGGFTDIPWKTSQSNQFRYSAGTFLFSYNAGIRKISIQYPNQAVCYKKDYGPCFGNADLYYRKVTSRKSITNPYGYSRRRISYTNTIHYEFGWSASGLVRVYKKVNDIRVYYKL